MENNKYFTPDIENLHIGYECEVFDYAVPSVRIGKNKLLKKWQFRKIEMFESDYSGLVILLPEEGIRVPYLTKEQIEAEKWEYLSEGYIGHQSFYKDDFEMSCFYDKHLLKIIKKEKVKTVVLYQGRCKCINEFRKIIKLLEI